MSETNDTQEQPKVEIAVKNFGPIVEANIDLRPLTVFVGPSNTGKTYFATLVYGLYGVFPNMIEPNILFPSGLQSIIGILHPLQKSILNNPNSPAKEKVQDILDKLNNTDRPFRLSDLPSEIQKLVLTVIDDKEVFGNKLQTELINCYDLNNILELRRLTDKENSEMAVSLMVDEKDQEAWNIHLNTSESDVILNSSLDDTMILLPEGLAISTNWKDEENFNFTLSGDWDVELNEGKKDIRGFLGETIKGRNCYYLPAARSGIMHSHRVISTSLVKRTKRAGFEPLPEVPTMSGVVADFIERIILYEEKKSLKAEMKQLSERLEFDVLAGQISITPSPNGYPDYQYLPQGTNHEIRLSQTSSMVSELAPLVLYLRGYVNPGDTLIIEEPEAHLHPGAQADMAVILAGLVRAGVRVIITTHSDWMLQEIGNLIRAGELEKAGEEVSDSSTSLQPEEVGIWHFQKNGMVEEIPYNRIDGIEPMEYLDVAEDLYNRSARLQNRLEELKGEKKRESE